MDVVKVVLPVLAPYHVRPSYVYATLVVDDVPPPATMKFSVRAVFVARTTALASGGFKGAGLITRLEAIPTLFIATLGVRAVSTACSCQLIPSTEISVWFVVLDHK
jgi:hypothetical protein